MEFATRDIISIACMKEVVEHRGGPNGGVFLSWAHLPSNIIDFSLQWYFRTHMKGQWKWEGFDFADLVRRIKSGEAVEVIPASHFFMGGVAVDEQCATRVPGLFACGEVACTGVHGANRLASNSLLETVVFAKRAVERLFEPGSYDPPPARAEGALSLLPAAGNHAVPTATE